MTDSGSSIEQQKRQALKLVNGNRLQEAKQAYLEITRRVPQDAAAWFMLGTVEGRLQNLPGAEAAMCNSLKADPNLAEAWLGLGQVLELQGRREDACNTYLKAIAQNPNLGDAHAALGHLYQAMGLHENAVENLSRAVNLGIRRPQVIWDLAEAHRGGGRFREALAAYRELLKNFPADAELHTKAAVMHYELTELDAAEQHYQQALQLNPDHLGAKLGLVDIWYLHREQDRALAAIQPLFETHKDDFGVVLLYSRLCHLDGSCDRVIRQAEVLLKRPGLVAQAERLLCFDLGRLYDAKQKYDKAFAYYRRGNKFAAGHYDCEEADRTIAAIMSVYSPEAMTTTATVTTERHRPLFIIGMPRSGTSLVEQILDSHPEVHGAGELTDLINILRSYRESLADQEGVTHEAGLMTVDDLNAMAERYLERLDSVAAGDERYVSDKMPGNFLRLGLIHKLFPYARIIHVRRNPIDTCLSCYFQDFSGAHTYCYDLDDLVHYYKNYRRLMNYWRDHLPNPMLEVDYETLVAEPEAEVRRMLDFLELDWDDHCMQFYKNKRAVITSSHAQVQSPLYSRSIGRWHNYEKHIAPLIEGFADEAK